MRILYDHQIFNHQTYGGISRYFMEIILHLPTENKFDISIYFSKNAYLNQHLHHLQKEIVTDIELLNKYELLWNKIEKGGEYISEDQIIEMLQKERFKLMMQNKTTSITQITSQNFDVFHPTYYDDYFLEYIGNKPFVLTIHDMIYEIFPEMLGDLQLTINKANLARKASHIIAVSEKTKKDIIDILSIPEDKISVIYHSSSIEPYTVDEPLDLPDNYILYVGERSLYKNFMFFVRSIISILNNKEDLFVVCTGRPFSQEEENIFITLGVEKRFIQCSVDDDCLYELYNRASVFVFPSYYEGFGIPILEAFKSSCPVVLSSSSCFPEIAKDAALYFNPKSSVEIKTQIENVLDNNHIRSFLVEKGKERAASFSWDIASRKTVEVYERILKNN